MDSRTKLLWVDDQIAELGAYVRALEETGFQVQCADSTPAALVLAGANEYNIILVDILMPPPDGIELLRRIQPLQPNASLAALSSYLYLDRFRQQLRGLSFPVEVIEKDIPNVEAEDFQQRFLDPIRHLVDFGVTRTIDNQDKRIALENQTGSDPYNIPLVDFMKKSILEKDVLVTKAREIASSGIDRAFAEGKIWVMLCGSANQIRASATTGNEILSEEEVMEFARIQQRAPYQFWKPLNADDVWSGCGDVNSTKDYPTVTLIFGSDPENTSKEEIRIVHFDTGAPMTFFSYEELLRLGAIRPTTNFGLATRKSHGSYWTVKLDVTVILRSQAGGDTKSVTLTGQAVRDWLMSPYARFCGTSCPVFDSQIERQLCLGRIGLIGRNLLVENSLILVLDGIQRKTLLGTL
ncbi:MAG TPA: response regulator [Blastocatellia bacterium]|nr:response regulator [Blastocatellia bacterium]